MSRLQFAIVTVLVAVIAAGLIFGITTPKAVHAHFLLRQSEFKGERLFHSPALGENGLSCSDCHTDGGRFSHHLENGRIPALVNAKTLFPQTQPDGQVITLEAAINRCIQQQLAGSPLSPQSQKLALLDLYLRHLSRFHER